MECFVTILNWVCNRNFFLLNLHYIRNEGYYLAANITTSTKRLQCFGVDLHLKFFFAEPYQCAMTTELIHPNYTINDKS